LFLEQSTGNVSVMNILQYTVEIFVFRIVIIHKISFSQCILEIILHIINFCHLQMYLQLILYSFIFNSVCSSASLYHFEGFYLCSLHTSFITLCTTAVEILVGLPGYECICEVHFVFQIK
jgi:hypothetical protein